MFRLESARQIPLHIFESLSDVNTNVSPFSLTHLLVPDKIDPNKKTEDGRRYKELTIVD